MRGSGRGARAQERAAPAGRAGAPEISGARAVGPHGCGPGAFGPCCEPGAASRPTALCLQGAFLDHCPNTPIAPISVGVEKGSCPMCDSPEWCSLALLLPLPPAMGFGRGETLVSSGTGVTGYGPCRTTERPRVAECGKHKESLLVCPTHLRFKEPCLHLHPFRETILRSE